MWLILVDLMCFEYFCAPLSEIFTRRYAFLLKRGYYKNKVQKQFNRITTDEVL